MPQAGPAPVVPPKAGATSPAATSGSTGSVMMTAGSTSTPQAGGMAAAGASGATTPIAGATGSAGAQAGSGAMTLPACPSGWTCQDPAKPLMDMGITDGMVTDSAGKPIAYACGNGGAVDCDQSNPKTSCPELSNPFCAHVSIPVLSVDLYSCAQLCTP
jgi:hypothetical protein